MTLRYEAEQGETDEECQMLVSLEDCLKAARQALGRGQEEGG
jgi:hypothetical protein